MAFLICVSPTSGPATNNEAPKERAFLRAKNHNCIREPHAVILHSIRSTHPRREFMKNARRLTMMGLLLCGVLTLRPNSWAQERANSRTNRQDLRHRFVG